MKIKYPGIAKLIIESFEYDERFGKPNLKFKSMFGTAVCRGHVALIKMACDSIGGCPSTSTVGKKAAQYAWMLVMHLDHDPELQGRYLQLMSKLPKEDYDSVAAAHLEDREFINRGLEQIYGTQMEQVGDGFVPLPIRTEGDIDQRRKHVGLDTLNAQIQRMFRGTRMKKVGAMRRFKTAAGTINLRHRRKQRMVQIG